MGESAIARRPTLDIPAAGLVCGGLGAVVGVAWGGGGPGAELLVADCACPLYLLRFWVDFELFWGSCGSGIAPILVLFRV